MLMFAKINRGFTLVELLIVIAILTILSTLGVSNFQTARLKARDVSRKTDLQTIAKSLEAYINDHRVYPSSSADGQIVCQPPGTVCAWGEPFTYGNTIYASELPSDSVDSQSYIYSSNGTSYTLYAKLENPQDPAIISIVPVVYCGSNHICNYKITSSNIQ